MMLPAAATLSAYVLPQAASERVGGVMLDTTQLRLLCMHELILAMC